MIIFKCQNKYKNYNIYFKLVMRAHRGKQLDWSKSFKLVDSKAVFDDLDTDNNELVINITSKVETTPAAQRKEDIIIPKIETGRRVTEPKKFAKI